MFIELTNTRGSKFIGNVNLLQAVFENKESKVVTVIGWNNNGGFEIKETYDEVIFLLKPYGIEMKK